MEYGSDRSVNEVARTCREGGAALLRLSNAKHCTRCHRQKPEHMIGWRTQITRTRTAMGRRAGAAVLCPSCQTTGSRAPQATMASRRQQLARAEAKQNTARR